MTARSCGSTFMGAIEQNQCQPSNANYKHGKKTGSTSENWWCTYGKMETKENFASLKHSPLKHSSIGSMHVACSGYDLFASTTVPCTRKQLCHVRSAAKCALQHLSDRIKKDDRETGSSFVEGSGSPRSMMMIIIMMITIWKFFYHTYIHSAYSHKLIHIHTSIAIHT